MASAVSDLLRLVKLPSLPRPTSLTCTPRFETQIKSEQPQKDTVAVVQEKREIWGKSCCAFQRRDVTSHLLREGRGDRTEADGHGVWRIGGEERGWCSRPPWSSSAPSLNWSKHVLMRSLTTGRQEREPLGASKQAVILATKKVPDKWLQGCSVDWTLKRSCSSYVSLCTEAKTSLSRLCGVTASVLSNFI